jgi:glycosyltransferase involved in cell wall biosynthesis
MIRPAPCAHALCAPALCAIVPTFNHHRVLREVTDRLSDAGLPVFVVDDGSTHAARAVIAALAPTGVQVLRHETNRGKGAAVATGVARAAACGFTHALQVDADGQHDLAALPRLIGAWRRHPEALIAGDPVFDGSAPASRRIGRQVTRFWTAVETLSLDLPDTMCGMRIYPLAPVSALASRVRLGQRMEFDTEILVRLVWAGVPIVRVPVAVRYPADNLSNFELFSDNLRISLMHARLVLELPFHAAGLLRRRPVVIGA